MIALAILFSNANNTIVVSVISKLNQKVTTSYNIVRK